MTEAIISHGSGQMRAQSISIQVSTRIRCNAGCKFCIARTTPGVEDAVSSKDVKLCGFSRLHVGLNYAKQLGATHAILTSRADPTQEDTGYLWDLVSASREYLPLVDMHTNGFLILPGMPRNNMLKQLVSAGLTMITFSIASFDAIENRNLMIVKRNAAELIPYALDLGLLVRCSLVMNKQGVRDFSGVMEYIRQAGELGAHMVVIREVWVPDVYGDFSPDVYDWNLENKIPIKPLQDMFIAVSGSFRNPYGLRERDPLPWGTPVFTVSGVFRDKTHGVNVTFARCEEATVGTVLKSIVHKPDGHGYRNWDDNGDILY